MSAKTRNTIARDRLLKVVSLCAALLVLLVMVVLFLAMGWKSRLTIHKFGLGFLFSQAWNPVTGNFGALSSIYGTVVSTIIAMLFAVPISLFSAFFLVEMAPSWLEKPVSQAIELLAAVPSIIYGMWGLFVFAPLMSESVQPFLSGHFGFTGLFSGPPMGIGMLSAGIILALMILPFITSITRDVLKMVPDSLRESAYGMGATPWEATRGITLRYGMNGVIGGLFLGLGRALGETMAVTFVIGNNHKVFASLFKPANTIASTIANEFSEASDPVYLSSLTELGLVLLCMSFLVQVGAHLWLKRLESQRGTQ